MIRSVIIMAVFLTSIQLEAIGYTQSLFVQKIITVTINQKGEISIGRDTLTVDQVTHELQERLWRSYLGTGKMYDAIHLEVAAGTQAGIITNAKNAIKEAQKKALIDVCLQKHKKLFDDLSNSQQNKIRRQLPVLFQQDY
jgi:biopolymer transport protein ExbD